MSVLGAETEQPRKWESVMPPAGTDGVVLGSYHFVGIYARLAQRRKSREALVEAVF